MLVGAAHHDAARVPDDVPWEEYRRDRPRPGMSYPVGRDLVERTLRETGAMIGTLELLVPVYVRHSEPADPLAVTVDWFSDARSHRTRSEASHLLLRVWAIPAEQRHHLRTLASDAVARACRWAAETRNRGTAWTASSHTLVLRYHQDELTTEET